MSITAEERQAIKRFRLQHNTEIAFPLLINLLLDKGVISREEWNHVLDEHLRITEPLNAQTDALVAMFRNRVHSG